MGRAADLVSPGYPAGTIYHRGRRCLYGFPQAPHIFCASAQDETSDFDLGGATDSDAIQTYPGDAIGALIAHGVSAEQLIILTAVGPYYVGEGPGTPFTPTTIDFLNIGEEPTSLCNPLKSSEGVIFADREVARLLVLAPTGNVRRSWDTGDLSDLAPHLIGGFTRLCLIDGCKWNVDEAGKPERYVAGINSDGDLAVMHYRRGEDILGWAPWETEGTFIDICVFNGRCYVIVLRGASYYLERFDEDYLTDDAILASGTSSLTNSHWASSEREVIWRETVDDEDRRASLGFYTADGSGVISGLEAEARDYEVGRHFDTEVKLWPPIDPNRPLSTAIRLARAIIDIVASGRFLVNEDEVTPYDYEDDQEELPPRRTRIERVDMLDCEDDVTVTLTQPLAAPLEIRAMVVEAS